MIRIGLSRLATTSLVFLTCSLWVSAQESTAEFDPPRTEWGDPDSVSYTHLPLPTSDLV